MLIKFLTASDEVATQCILHDHGDIRGSWDLFICLTLCVQICSSIRPRRLLTLVICLQRHAMKESGDYRRREIGFDAYRKKSQSAWNEYLGRMMRFMAGDAMTKLDTSRGEKGRDEVDATWVPSRVTNEPSFSLRLTYSLVTRPVKRAQNAIVSMSRNFEMFNSNIC